MRRRLDLAASLVHRPAVLFLDEPTTGLDPRSRNELWSVIEDLVADGTTVLLTTQYLEEADRLADYLAVVDHGQIIAQGTPAGLKAGLGSTVLEIGMPGEGSALMALQALAPLGVQPPILDGTTVKVTVADGGTALLQALRALDAEGIAPTGVTLREPSLDDVFLSLTGHAAMGREHGMTSTGTWTPPGQKAQPARTPPPRRLPRHRSRRASPPSGAASTGARPTSPPSPGAT